MTISIQIPEGAEPGDTLSFTTQDGRTCELLVPPNSQVGDVLELQIASEHDHEHENNNDNNRHHPTTNTAESHSENITKIQLSNGQDLEFVSELPSDYHAPATSSQTTKTDDDTQDEQEYDTTFACAWPSGIFLAQHILKEGSIRSHTSVSNQKRRRRILELGSGLGMVGLSWVAVEAYHHDKDEENDDKLPTTTLVLTDVPTALPLLHYNLERNQMFLPSTVQVSIQALPWSLEEDTTTYSLKEPKQSFDCLLGSDLLYNVEHIPALVATIRRWLHPTRGMVIWGARWRKPELERSFFQSLEDVLEWKPLPTSSQCTLSWQDFGNPNSEASNQYFWQTQIGVPTNNNSHNKNGNTTTTAMTPLAEITQEIAEQLPPEEYKAWEACFLQIYIGVPKESNNPNKQSEY